MFINRNTILILVVAIIFAFGPAVGLSAKDAATTEDKKVLDVIQ